MKTRNSHRGVQDRLAVKNCASSRFFTVLGGDRRGVARLGRSTCRARSPLPNAAFLKTGSNARIA